MNKKTLEGWNNMPNREIYDRFSSISWSPTHINKLYQELAASKAEVERLKGVTKEFDASFKKGSEVMRQAETEIYRLKDKLKHAVYILESYNPDYADTFKSEFK